MSDTSHAEVLALVETIRGAICRVIEGQEAALQHLLTALVAGGHVLLEGVPGVAKTLLVRSVAAALAVDFSRIQFTPDLMPSDIPGVSIFDAQTSAFRFRPGPLFADLVLADEINRAPAKTQAALLEAMQEQRVSMDGETHRLSALFMVVATQNPIEYEGTYPLPEAQLDRFLMKILVDYPSAEAEKLMLLKMHQLGPQALHPAQAIQAVATHEAILHMRTLAYRVEVDQVVLDYIVALVRQSRSLPSLSLGASPRAGVMLLHAAKALAILRGKTYVTPDDVRELVPPLESVLGPQQTVRLCYHVRSLRRGLHTFGAVVLRLEHGLGLLQRHINLPLSDAIRVYPQFVKLHDYALLARIDQRHDIVRRPQRIQGYGTDFESLRPYVTGEDLRAVDWKASARRGTLMSRHFQVEKGQQVAVLVDAGRLMTERIGKFTRFEYALNATILVSYVAQKRGDSIAVATFSNRIESFLPPTRGPRIVPRVLNSLYRVEPRAVESDYWHVVAAMMARLQRRSLVMVLTSVLDPAASTGLQTNLVRAAAKHLVLCVVLTEPYLAEMADRLPQDVSQAYTKAAASQMLLHRHLALEHMRSKGILVLETDPGHFSIQLVRRYLDIRQGDLQ